MSGSKYTAAMNWPLPCFLVFVLVLALSGDLRAEHEQTELSVQHLFAQGYQLFAVGEFESAAGLFQQVLRVDPHHVSARNYLKESLSLLARRDREQQSHSGPDSYDDRAPPSSYQAPPSTAEPAAEGSREPAAYARASSVRSQSSPNPRADSKGSIALGIVGPTLGLGVAVQGRPHWAVAVGGGAGGLGVLRAGEGSGIFALYAEAQVLPIPWRLTPVLGVGISVLMGALVTEVDLQGVSAAGQGLARVLPYVLLGVRYDAPIGLWVSGGIGLVPLVVVVDGEAVPSALPFPGFRLGMNL